MKLKEKNKGFTLVELIIVIAIIAVLAAVLAPQYMRYVERSRQTNDLQIATNYMRAATAAVTDLSAGLHTQDSEWYVFKWGYTTDNKGNMNIHMGTAPVVNGVPGLADTQRDPIMQQQIAEVMGWIDEKGVIDISKVERPQSDAVKYTDGQMNSLVFYINLRTGEILLDKTISSNWVNEIGLDVELTP